MGQRYMEEDEVENEFSYEKRGIITTDLFLMIAYGITIVLIVQNH